MITSANTTASTSITAENYAFLQQYIYRESGIVLEENKQYLLDARLTPILKNAQLGTINDLCALLKATSPEPLKRAVVEAITTHETLFFRDAAAFEALKSTILPQLKTLREANRRARLGERRTNPRHVGVLAVDDVLIGVVEVVVPDRPGAGLVLLDDREAGSAALRQKGCHVAHAFCFSLQAMQTRVHGIASSRAGAIMPPQSRHTP